MADLSKIKLNGVTYNLKDAVARENFPVIKVYANINDSGKYLLSKDVWGEEPYPYVFWFGTEYLVYFCITDGDGGVDDIRLYVAKMSNYHVSFYNLSGEAIYYSEADPTSNWNGSTIVTYLGETRNHLYGYIDTNYSSPINSTAYIIYKDEEFTHPYQYVDFYDKYFGQTITIIYKDGDNNPIPHLYIINGYEWLSKLEEINGSSCFMYNHASYYNNASYNYQANGTSHSYIDYNNLQNKPTIPTVPTNVSSFTNDAGYLTSYTETDPTVPSWAKQSSKPTYTASEVGAAASTHAHGNITSGGDMTATAAIASGDRLVINDESASKLTSSTITFGSSTTQYLANNGTWQNIPTAYDDTALAARVTALEQIPWVTYYTGSSTPSNSQGSNGDLYFQTSQ